MDLSWNAMESFDNEQCELESLVQGFREAHEKKISQRRWLLAVPVLVLFLLVVGAMFSAATRHAHADVGPPEMKDDNHNGPTMTRSKYQNVIEFATLSTSP
jgi:H+/Cl- antiporter ClcA